MIYTQRVCKYCGKTFFPAMDANVYCSVECCTAYNKQRQKERLRAKWEANPRYCDLCGGVIPYGRKRFCSKECQLEMKRRMAVQKKAVGEKRPRKAPQKEPGVEAEAKELGISYGQYRATGGKKPEDIADKYNAPVYEPEKWLGDKPIQVHQIPPGGPARIKKRVK